MSLNLDDGRSLDFRPYYGTKDSAQFDGFEVIPQRMFTECPICGDPATDDEHVPPASIGGRIMTRTCAPCNNNLGSRVEVDLADWFDGASSRTRVESTGIRGARNPGRLLLGFTPDGQFGLMPEREPTADIYAMLRSGSLSLTATPPDFNRYRIALLKQAYLAGCMRFGVPEGDAAEEVRRDLIAARDAPSRREVRQSRLAHGLHVFRFPETVPPGASSVMRAVAHLPEGPVEGVILVGRIFVSWTSDLDEDEQSSQQQRHAVTLQVGAPVGGTIAARRNA
jgi:hypothetical protein